MPFTAGQKVRASDLNALLDAADSSEARYARTSGTQSLVSGQNNQMQFPSQIRNSGNIVPVGTGNNAFRVPRGKWLCIVSLRLGTNVAASGELSLAFGPSAAWAVGNVITVEGSGTGNYTVSGVGVNPGDGPDYFFSANFWQTSGATAAVNFGQGTSIEIIRQGSA